MIEPRLHPILQIRAPYGEPSHPPFGFWITDDHWAQAKNKGGVTNLVRYSLDQSVRSEIANAGTGNKKERRNRAISLGYSLQPQDEYNTCSAWETVPTAAEKAQLDAAVARYTTLRDELLEEQEDGPLDAEKAQLLQDYVDNIGQAQLLSAYASTGQVGFIEEIPSIFGNSGKCLHDMNGVPNTSKVRRSTFRLMKDRALHLALRFAKPQLDQRETSFKIAFWDFIIEFRGGRSVNLKKYRNSVFGAGTSYNIKQIAKLETQLETELDKGRLTDEDMTYIEAREVIKRQQRKAAKAAGITPTKNDEPNPAYRPYLSAIQKADKEIQARQTLKQRAPGASIREAKRLEEILYAIDESVNLNEDLENFYDSDIRLTLLPQRRGFLTLTLTNGEPVTIDLPETIETKEFHTVWFDSLIVFKSNGGAFDWQFIYPTVESDGELRIKDVEVPFVIQEGDIIYYAGDWDHSGPGCDISFLVQPSFTHTPEHPKYDFVAKFRSDVGKSEDATNKKDIKNAYFPWLYSLQFFINSGPRPDNTEILWDSLDFGTSKTFTPGTPNPNRDNPIMDVRLNMDDADDSRRGAQFTIDIMDPLGTAGFTGFKNHMCDLSCGLYIEAANELWQPNRAYVPGNCVSDGGGHYNCKLAHTSTEGNPPSSLPDKWQVYTPNTVIGILPYLSNCVIREAALMNVRTFENELGEIVTVEELAETFSANSFWRVSVGDVWTLLDRYVIRDEIVLDDRTLGQRLRMMIGLQGWTEDDLAGISEDGVMAGPKAPKAGAGQPPLSSPSLGRNLGSLLREMMAEDGMNENYQELRLTAYHGVFTLDAPSTDPVFAFSSAATVTGPQVVKAGATLPQDWSRFYNSYEVHGRRDPRTDEPIKKAYRIEESINGTPTGEVDEDDNPILEYHALHVGEEIRYDLVTRDDLDDEGQVERALFTLVIRNSKSGDFAAFESFWLYPPRYPGDFGTVDGRELELVKVNDMSIKGITNANLIMRPVVEIP